MEGPSLLGLVPILPIVLAVFSAFPFFNEMQERVKAVLLSPLVPMICPLQSGPWTILVWTRQEKGNGQETRA